MGGWGRGDDLGPGGRRLVTRRDVAAQVGQQQHVVDAREVAEVLLVVPARVHRRKGSLLVRGEMAAWGTDLLLAATTLYGPAAMRRKLSVHCVHASASCRPISYLRRVCA